MTGDTLPGVSITHMPFQVLVARKRISCRPLAGFVPAVELLAPAVHIVDLPFVSEQAVGICKTLWSFTYRT